MSEENQPPHHEEYLTMPELEEALQKLRAEHERINERVDLNGTRIDAISASLREYVMRPLPDISKGVQGLVAISLSVSLASFAATLTLIILLVSHIIGGH